MKKNDASINKQRLTDAFNELEQFGRTGRGGINRPALSDEDKGARDLFCKWMKEAGLKVRIDDVGNYYGHRSGQDDSLPPVVIGSHLDTVYNGGRFDGITGVQSGLEVIRTLNDYGVETKRPIELMVFTNEEGTRFEPSMLGSGVLAGVFNAEEVLKIRDRDDYILGEELSRIGYKGEKTARLTGADCYFELHVEQGPVLENEGYELGVLTGIQGMTHLEVTVTGVKDHAGPSPMKYRRDSLMGSARMICRFRDIAYEVGHDTTITVGKIKVTPCSSNVIPGETKFSIDIRNAEDEYMYQATELCKNAVRRVCAEDGLDCNIVDFWRVNAIHFPQNIVNTLEESAKKLKLNYKKMVSGAGHDASYMSMFIPTGMIFVPSIGGLSHCEEELSDFEQIAQGADLLLEAVLARAEKVKG